MHTIKIIGALLLLVYAAIFIPAALCHIIDGFLSRNR